MKICLICKKKFKSKNINQIMCSFKCREKKRLTRNKKEYKKECIICNIKFKTTNNIRQLCGSNKCERERALWRNQKCHKKNKYYEKDKVNIIKKQLEYYHKNKVKISLYRKKYRQVNKEMIKIREKKYRQHRLKTDRIYKIRKLLRDRINCALGKNYKKTKSLELIGCTVQELKQYLENKFKQGMSWSNHGINSWHIDHIKPLAVFNLENVNEQKKAFHYTNLQPLWAHENLKKNRFTDDR